MPAVCMQPRLGAQVNGVLQKNPAYVGGGPSLPQNVAAPSQALTAVCTVDDIAAQNASGGARVVHPTGVMSPGQCRRRSIPLLRLSPLLL